MLSSVLSSIVTLLAATAGKPALMEVKLAPEFEETKTLLLVAVVVIYTFEGVSGFTAIELIVPPGVYVDHVDPPFVLTYKELPAAP